MPKVIPWTEKEKRVLKELYPYLPVRVIGRFLGRSVNGCEHIAGKLKLRKNRGNSAPITKEAVLAWVFVIESDEWRAFCQEAVKIRKKRWEILSNGGFPMRRK